MKLENILPSSTPERFAYWYFRLNGFLTTENFVIHPDTGSNQRTDADLLAVRFSDRQENLAKPMEDDPRVSDCPSAINVVIAEIKRGRCALNGPWTDKGSENMKRALCAIGCVREADLLGACEHLYDHGSWANDQVTIRLLAIGDRRAPGLCIPDEQQVTWSEMIQFCMERFRNYRHQKSSVGQWSDDGRLLREHALSKTPELRIRQTFGLLCRRPSSGGDDD